MANMIDFDSFAQEPDLDAMDRDALLDYLEAVRAQIVRLDRQEPVINAIPLYRTGL